MDNNVEKIQTNTGNGKVGAFLQAKSKVFGIISITLVILVAIFAVMLSVIDSSSVKKIAIVDNLSKRWEAIKDQDVNSVSAERDAILTELSIYTTGIGAFSKSKALSLSAEIYAVSSDWIKAEESYFSAYKANTKSFQAPIALYNAACMAENRGDTTRALELYSLCDSLYGDSFYQMPRVLFSIARLQETLNDFSAANATYQRMLDDWPDDNWTDLANSRILAIKIKQDLN